MQPINYNMARVALKSNLGTQDDYSVVQLFKMEPW